MTNFAMNAKDLDAATSLRRSFALISIVLDTFATIVGQLYTHKEVENFTSHWLRRVAIDHVVHNHSDGEYYYPL